MRPVSLLSCALLLVSTAICAQQKAASKAAPPAANQAAKPGPAVQGPPETILFPNKYGDVTFTHKQHFLRVNGKCDTCHPSIFPQSRADINYRKALHRAAEASKTACASCHRVGGTSFAADSNCTKCHASKYKRGALDSSAVIAAWMPVW
jgi:c(7)-type cytochrome triheme protein